MHTAHQFFPVAGNPDPVDDVRQSEAAIRAAGWWHRAPFSEHWPLTTQEVAELLATAGQFAVDAEDLDDLMARRLLAPPATGEAGHEWDAADVLRAGNLLEARQQWQATPSWHDAKKHPCQILLEQARENGEVGLAADPQAHGPHFDVKHLIELLVASDVHEGRRKIACLLKAVLEVDHGVIVP